MSHQLRGGGCHSTHEKETLARFRPKNKFVQQLRKLMDLRGYQLKTAEQILKFREKRAARKIEVK